MFRKYIGIMLSLLALLQCIGCTEPVSTVQYNAMDIALYSFDAPSSVVKLKEDDLEYLLSLWNSAQWEDSVTKTSYDYTFEFDTTMRYSSDYGVFNDIENQRHFFVSEDVRNEINMLIKSTLNEE